MNLPWRYGALLDVWVTVLMGAGEHGCFHALGVGGPEMLVERECLAEARATLFGLFLLEVAVPDAFQGAGLL